MSVVHSFALEALVVPFGAAISKGLGVAITKALGTSAAQHSTCIVSAHQPNTRQLRRFLCDGVNYCNRLFPGADRRVEPLAQQSAPSCFDEEAEKARVRYKFVDADTYVVVG